MDTSIDAILKDSCPVSGADILKLIRRSTGKTLEQPTKEPNIGTIIIEDEGDCYHYGVYLGGGWMVSTAGLSDHGKIYKNALMHPWADTGVCGIPEVLHYEQFVGLKYPYDVCHNNCWNCCTWMIGVPTTRYKDAPKPKIFYTPHQDWNKASLIECGPKTGWTSQLLNIVIDVISYVNWKKLVNNIKPLITYHNYMTSDFTSIKGAFAWLMRQSEIWEIDLTKIINFLKRTLLPEAPFSPHYLIAVVLGAIGFCASFLMNKALNGFSNICRNFNKFISNFKELSSYASVGSGVVETFLGTTKPWDPEDASIAEVSSDIADGAVQTGDQVSTQLEKINKAIKNLKIHMCSPTAPESLKESLKRAEAAKAALEGMLRDMVHRHKPFVIMMAGPPGVGKTQFAQHLAKQLAADLKTGTYSITPGVDYWDDYNNQGVVIWEDFGASDYNNEVKLFQRMADTMPMSLNCDTINKKGTKFTSRILIMTTNLEDISCGHNSSAVLRRIDLHLFVESFAVTHWQAGGCMGPKPHKDDFSHLTFYQLPKYATDWKGNTLFKPGKIVRLSPNTVVANAKAMWRLQAPGPERSAFWLKDKLNLSYTAAFSIMADLRRGVIPQIKYDGEPFTAIVCGYYLDVYSGEDGYLTGTIEKDGEQLSNEVWYDAQTDVVHLSPMRRVPPVGDRFHEWVQAWGAIAFIKSVMAWLASIITLEDSARTADKISNVVQMEAKGKTKRGRGQKHSKKMKKYKFTPKEYAEFLRRREDAAERGIVYTVDDYLEDIGADQDSEDEAFLDLMDDSTPKKNYQQYDWDEEGFKCTFVETITKDGFPVGCATLVGGDLALTATHVAEDGDSVRGKQYSIIHSNGELSLIKIPGLKSPKVSLYSPKPGDVLIVSPKRGRDKPNIPIKVNSIGNNNIAGKFIFSLIGTCLASNDKQDGLSTEPGDCGSPYIKFVKGAPHIAAIHTAGSAVSGKVAGVMIPQKLNLEGKLAYVPSKKPPENTTIWYTKMSEEMEIDMHVPLVGTKDPRCALPLSSILTKMMKPYTEHHTGYVPPAELEAAKSVVMAKLKAIVGKPTTLSAVEALETLDPHTSSGYPNYTKKDPSLPHVQSTVERVQKWLDGEGPLHDPIYTAALKDEPVKEKKVSTDPSRRLLWCAPLETSLACAAIVTPACAALKQHRWAWPGKVGMNPTQEWWLLDGMFPDNILCVDYSRWDSTMPEEIYHAGLEVLYGLVDHPKSAELAEILAKPRKVIVNDQLITVFRGLPSGTPATSILNCICHWLASTMAVSRATGLPPCTAVNWPLAVYGDDEVIGCPNNKFANLYAKAMRGYGFHPTNPDKSEDFSPQPKAEMEFLSRKTNRVFGKVVGALKISSLKRQLYLTRGPQHTDVMAINSPGSWFSEQLMNVLGEASLHGRKIYDEILSLALRSAFLAGVDLEPWTFSSTFRWATSVELVDYLIGYVHPLVNNQQVSNKVVNLPLAQEVKKCGSGPTGKHEPRKEPECTKPHRGNSARGWRRGGGFCGCRGTITGEPKRVGTGSNG
uniref:Genome polyprotein n=1 Tax=Recovirus sp. TaxID=2219046 RepID=A0A2Z4BVH5_9CALI|nr:MAG: RNA-dependent RNA polymerase [Recovirus sp.]